MQKENGMRFSDEDIKIMKSWGCTPEDIAQIGRALPKTDFRYRGEKIGRDRASDLLGRREFLSGMARSAFHFTAVRLTDRGEEVFFDSSRFFKS